MYEQVAARYDEDRERFSIPRDDVVDQLLASRPGVRVLDVGCGTGSWLAAQRGFFGDAPVTFVGADPSPAMLAEARAKGVPNLMRARAEDLPLEDEAIHYLTSRYCFHHFQDKDRAVDEIVRVLAPGGLFRITNIEPTAAQGWWVYECFPETVALDAARFWSPERTTEALEAHDLTVEILLDTGGEEISAAEALADAERRVVSELALLDDEAYERGLAELRRAAEVPAATVTTTRSRLQLTARRTR
ncbi:MAG TPA: methyltransferase domain-containing protein [Acidimicrobiales bacterium]|nr:methyltransferase domain-containing protein [Acidimicrobiales bacterium]